MQYRILICFLSLISYTMNAQNDFIIGYEKNDNTTASYHETIAYYNSLESAYSKIKINEFGSTDSGFPLHEVIIDMNESFNPSKEKCRLFINNAIHPGEPCGVDASMMLARDILMNNDIQRKLKNIQIIILPFYNIGGGLNRNSTTRANQNGPESYGFRGNAKNLDLNRDFVKCDSKNAKSFNQLFNKWEPHVMIDNHTSNGADYQYTMTLIATQKDKLDTGLSNMMQEKMLPFLYQDMKERKWEMTPYVYAEEKPDDGIIGFLDLPRYSSGYAALHHTISFMPETHMLKPYSDRVVSTYEFILSMIDFLEQEDETLRTLKEKAVKKYQNLKAAPINWELDKSQKEEFLFKGYEAKYRPSEVSGKDRLYYDQSEAYEKPIPFYNTYKTIQTVNIPEEYIIPQAYDNVVERLIWNGVEVRRLEEDKTIEVELYYIDDFKTVSHPYEGHYLHSKTQLRKELKVLNFFKGDYVVSTRQKSCQYIVSVLEPEAPDSFFAWNFFDGVLMQKEWFSSYVFEDIAADLLKNDAALQEKIEMKKKEDEAFANDAGAQLRWVYHHSSYYEPTHNRYPVFRVVAD